MKKATIFYGVPGEGHTMQAQNLAVAHGHNYLYLSALHLPEKITISDIPVESVIIDNCPKDFDFEYYFNPITQESGIKFIFCTTKKPVSKSASFKARFELIDAADLWKDLPF